MGKDRLQAYLYGVGGGFDHYPGHVMNGLVFKSRTIFLPVFPRPIVSSKNLPPCRQGLSRDVRCPSLNAVPVDGGIRANNLNVNPIKSGTGSVKEGPGFRPRIHAVNDDAPAKAQIQCGKAGGDFVARTSQLHFRNPGIQKRRFNGVDSEPEGTGS